MHKILHIHSLHLPHPDQPETDKITIRFLQGFFQKSSAVFLIEIFLNPEFLKNLRRKFFSGKIFLFRTWQDVLTVLYSKTGG